MLHRYINQFVEYCQLADFSVRSIQALTARLNEFEAFLKSQKIWSIKKVTYQHLINFIADFKSPSIHVRKFLLLIANIIPLSMGDEFVSEFPQ
jgi:site-specific recombinase XerD